MVPRNMERNNLLISRADSLRRIVSTDVERVLQNFDDWQRLAYKLSADIERRVWFHVEQSLKQVSYNVRHSFIRAWDVMDERTLKFVTSGYYQTARKFREMLDSSLDGRTDNATRFLMYFLTERDLETRLNLVSRAMDNITFLNQSYTSASAVYFFGQTPDRRYEHTYVVPQYIRHNPKYQATLFEKWEEYNKDFLHQIKTLIQINKHAFEWKPINTTAAENSLEGFQLACRRYNYYRFMFYTKIVLPPEDLADANLMRFQNQLRDLRKAFDNLRSALNDSKSLISQFRSGPWLTASRAVERALDYIHNASLPKKDIAQIVGGQATENAIADLRSFLKDQRNAMSYTAEMGNSLEWAYVNLFLDMITDSTTKNFYKKIHDDVTSIVANETNRDYLIDVLAQMLKKPEEELSNIGLREWEELVNSDFAYAEPAAVKANLTRMFERQQEFISLGTVETHLEQFTEALQLLRRDMQDYISGLTLNHNFFE